MQHVYMAYPAAGHTCCMRTVPDIDDLAATTTGKCNTTTSHSSTNWTTTILTHCERSICTPCPSWCPWSLWSISNILRKFSVLVMHHCTTCSIDNFAGCKSTSWFWHHFHNQERSQEKKLSETGRTSSDCVLPTHPRVQEMCTFQRKKFLLVAVCSQA